MAETKEEMCLVSYFAFFSIYKNGSGVLETIENKVKIKTKSKMENKKHKKLAILPRCPIRLSLIS